MKRVQVMTRQGCHLCEEGIAVVRRVCGELGVEWETIDIDTDPALHRAYTDQVPVTLVDGRRHDYWRVDEARLRQALAR